MLFRFRDPLEDIQRGEEHVTGLFDRGARLAAGRRAAAGDYAGAGSQLMSRGLFSEARPVIAEGERQTTQARTREALGAYNRGDYGRVREVGAELGDAGLIGTAEEGEETERKRRTEYLLNAATALRRVPAGQRQQALQQFILPTIEQMGAPDLQAQIGGLTEEQLTDESLDAFSASLGQMAEMKVEKLEGGTLVAYDPRDPRGTMEVLRQGERKPVAVAPGGALVDPDTGAVLFQSDALPEVRTITTRDAAGNETEQIVTIPRGGGRSGSSSVPSVDEDAARAALAGALPGGFRITSGQRSPERNAAVGGAANSYHLRGQAFDIVPADGDMAAAAAALRATGQFAEVINEGDHVHVAWSAAPSAGDSAAPAGARVVASATRAAQGPEWVQTTTPDGTPILRNTRTGDEKAAPGRGAGQQKITDGQRNVASYARDMLDANEAMNQLATRGVFKPSAQILISERNGVARLVASNPNDTEFVAAANAFLLPLLRKETGAAVTATELQTYMDTYMPQPRDTPDTMRRKAELRRGKMVTLLRQSRAAYADQFGQIPAEVRTMVPARPTAPANPRTTSTADLRAIGGLK